jgi:hypothetical protein
MTDYKTILAGKAGCGHPRHAQPPEALNALNSEVLAELIDAFAAYDADESQRCLVLTGSGEKAFAAGADIKEMQPQGFADMYSGDFFAGWEKVTATRKPWIAAVNGFALGGGCEVAMMADFIIAPKCQVRPAGDQAWRHAGHGRVAAADLGDRQGQGDGNVPDRPDDGRRRGRAVRAGREGRACRPAARRGAEDRRADRRDAAACRDRGQGNGQRRASRSRYRRASASSVACSTACSGPRTRRKAWPPSSRSGRATGRDGRMARIAFIGLGHMGGGMAANLVKAGHDVTPSTLATRRSTARLWRGCVRSGSSDEACKDAEAVITMLARRRSTCSRSIATTCSEAPPRAPS